MTSKDGVKLAGYSFVGGNPSVTGSFVQKKIQYDYAAEGYQIPIIYAQAIFCETDD